MGLVRLVFHSIDDHIGVEQIFEHYSDSQIWTWICQVDIRECLKLPDAILKQYHEAPEQRINRYSIRIKLVKTGNSFLTFSKAYLYHFLDFTSIECDHVKDSTVSNIWLYF